MSVDVSRQLATFAMLGRIFNERIELDAAVKGISTDVSQWETASTVTALYAHDVGDNLVDVIPELIATYGTRPARAVASMLAYAVRFGIELGTRLERKRAEAGR